MPDPIPTPAPQRLYEDVRARIDYFLLEYDIDRAAVYVTLELVQRDLLDEMEGKHLIPG